MLKNLKEKEISKYERVVKKRSLFEDVKKIAEICFTYAEECEENNDLKRAIKYYKKSADYFTKLSVSTGAFEFHNNVAVVYYRLGCVICTKDGYLTKEAKSHFINAYYMWDILSKQCPDNSEYARRRDIVKQYIF